MDFPQYFRHYSRGQSKEQSTFSSAGLPSNLSFRELFFFLIVFLAEHQNKHNWAEWKQKSLNAISWHYFAFCSSCQIRALFYSTTFGTGRLCPSGRFGFGRDIYVRSGLRRVRYEGTRKTTTANSVNEIWIFKTAERRYPKVIGMVCFGSAMEGAKQREGFSQVFPKSVLFPSENECNFNWKLFWLARGEIY